MNDQRKPATVHHVSCALNWGHPCGCGDKPVTDDWTGHDVLGYTWQEIVTAHNAALAVERAYAAKYTQELREQLTAERKKREEAQRRYQRDYDELLNLNKRDKHKPLVKALQEIANASEASADSLRRYAANEIARLNQNTGLDWIGRGDQ